ncbi:MAG: DUF2079 domain-containing protein [Ardenticatenaceae bacterium]|nr:DUF2079 domain-containing protein [Ardenticatenaceae bacterium]
MMKIYRLRGVLLVVILTILFFLVSTGAGWFSQQGMMPDHVATRLQLTAWLGLITLYLTLALRWLPLNWQGLLDDTAVNQRIAQISVGILVLTYILIFGFLTFRRHATFNSATYDLGIQDQLVWNTAHGRFYATSLEVKNYLGDHFKPLVILLAPLYWITPSVYWLLAFQTIALSLGAIPLYKLAKRRLHSPLAGLIIAFVYLLYPSVGAVNLFDFHWEATVIPLFIAAIDAVDRGNWRETAVWLFLAMLGKEDIGLTVAAFGIWTIWRYRRWRFGLTWLGLGITTSLLTLFVLIPALRQGPSDTLARYAWLGNSPGDMIQTMLLHPSVIIFHILDWNTLFYALNLFAPLLLLSFWNSQWLITLPAMGYNLLSASPFQQSVYFQYVTPIAPFVLTSMVMGLEWIFSRWLRESWQRAGVLIGLLLSTSLYVLPLAIPAQAPHLPNETAVHAALAQIPPETAVFTTNYYGPHLSHRQQLITPHDNDEFVRLRQADTILLNIRDHRSVLTILTCTEYAELLTLAEADHFGVAFAQDGVLILTRQATSPINFNEHLYPYCRSEQS